MASLVGVVRHGHLRSLLEDLRQGRTVNMMPSPTMTSADSAGHRGGEAAVEGQALHPAPRVEHQQADDAEQAREAEGEGQHEHQPVARPGRGRSPPAAAPGRRGRGAGRPTRPRRAGCASRGPPAGRGCGRPGRGVVVVGCPWSCPCPCRARGRGSDRRVVMVVSRGRGRARRPRASGAGQDERRLGLAWTWACG